MTAEKKEEREAYAVPEMEIVLFDEKDVITTSGDVEGSVIFPDMIIEGE